MNSEVTLLSENDASKVLNISVKTLQSWRLRRAGPRYFKISNRVRYSLDDLREYLKQCLVEPRSAHPQ
jgi:Helix-turn-helix domain